MTDDDLPPDPLDQVLADNPIAAHASINSRITDLQTKRWVRSMTLLIIGGPLLFALNIGVAIKTHVDNDRSLHTIVRGVSCLLADLDDHRHTNQFAHESLAKNHHFPEIIQPDVIPLTVEEAAALKMECNHFIRSTLGIRGGYVPGHEAKEQP